MKKTLTVLLFLCVMASFGAAAQTSVEVRPADTSSVVSAVLVDSTLVGVDVMGLLSSKDGGRVTINQSVDVSRALDSHIQSNRSRKISGYRVRIYFDNNQNARQESNRIAREFASAHPSVRVYQSHVSPYFKVTVGDFRTKADAQNFARSISGKYPSVFLTKENINYPEI